MGFIFVLVLTLCSFVPARADMGDIDLEVRVIISEHLNVIPDDIHSLRFTNNEIGCTYVVEAQVLDKTCNVCFQGNIKSAYASDVICK